MKSMSPKILGLTVLASCLTLAGVVNGQSVNRITVKSTQTITPVVELYTSEGCSSCPKADNFLSDLGETIDENFNAVLLAFHVDYWNWLGWPDPFSKSEYTDRQRKIGDINNQRSIYTPEIVVAGKEVRGGPNIIQYIKNINSENADVSITLDLDADNLNNLNADFEIDNMAQGRAQAHVVIFENDIVREIGGGENRGRTLTHDYVVRYWGKSVALLPGKTRKMLSLKIGQDWNHKNLGLAVVVVDPGNGKTLQALSTPINSLYSI